MVETIGLSIESVLQQTCDDWELIIVDDCSSDGTWELLQQKYTSHAKISLHRNDQNLKQWGNLNRCLELATGHWLGFLPADDTYRLHALETIKREVENRDDAILWMHAHLCHGDGIVPNIVPVYNRVTEFTSDELAELLYLKGNIFGELSSFFCKTNPTRINTIRFRNSKAEDIDFWIRYLRMYNGSKAMYWPDVLAQVLQHDQSASSNIIKSRENLSRVLVQIGELGELGWPLSIVIKQYLRALIFLIRRWPKIPGNRMELFLDNVSKLKITRKSRESHAADL